MRLVWEIGHAAGIARLLVAVAVLGSAQGCKRQGIVAADEQAETAAGATPASTCLLYTSDAADEYQRG